jgi:hypothetical protein
VFALPSAPLKETLQIHQRDALVRRPIKSSDLGVLHGFSKLSFSKTMIDRAQQCIVGILRLLVGGEWH